MKVNVKTYHLVSSDWTVDFEHMNHVWAIADTRNLFQRLMTTFVSTIAVLGRQKDKQEKKGT
jgi:hypothetical protein